MTANNKVKFNVINTNQINSVTPPNYIEEEVYSKILSAYECRLKTKNLKRDYIDINLKIINNFTTFTGFYPWDWTSDHFDTWCASIYDNDNNSERTQRRKQGIIARFQKFIVESPMINDLCLSNFSKKPVMICSEENLIPHKVEDENKEYRTAFSREYLSILWDYFDEQIKLAYRNKSKKLKVLMRDKVLYFIIYWYGLRANEASMLDVDDFLKNPQKPHWDRFGGVLIRYGKASHGSPPKRRKVWTITDESVDYLKWYFEQVRPLFGTENIKCAFLSERGKRLSQKSITRNFKEYLRCAGLPTENYSTHCLRHSYISHLSENLELSPRFIQDQVGHEYLATTQGYTHISSDFVRKHLDSVIERQVSKFTRKDEN